MTSYGSHLQATEIDCTEAHTGGVPPKQQVMKFPAHKIFPSKKNSGSQNQPNPKKRGLKNQKKTLARELVVPH